MRLARHPGKQTAIRVNASSGGHDSLQTECQAVERQIGVAGGSREGEHVAFADRLIADEVQHRRGIHLGYCHGDRLAITQCPVAHYHVERIEARPLRFGGEPGKEASGLLDVRPTRHRPRQAVCQRVGWQIAVRCRRRKGEQLQFINRLAANGIQHRRTVADCHVRDGACERTLIAGSVCGAGGESVGAESECDGGKAEIAGSVCGDLQTEAE